MVALVIASGVACLAGLTSFEPRAERWVQRMKLQRLGYMCVERLIARF